MPQYSFKKLFLSSAVFGVLCAVLVTSLRKDVEGADEVYQNTDQKVLAIGEVGLLLLESWRLRRDLTETYNIV